MSKTITVYMSSGKTHVYSDALGQYSKDFLTILNEDNMSVIAQHPMRNVDKVITGNSDTYQKNREELFSENNYCMAGVIVHTHTNDVLYPYEGGHGSYDETTKTFRVCSKSGVTYVFPRKAVDIFVLVPEDKNFSAIVESVRRHLRALPYAEDPLAGEALEDE